MLSNETEKRTCAELLIREGLKTKADFISALPFGMEIRMLTAGEPIYQYVYDLNGRTAEEISEIIRGMNASLDENREAALSDGESRMLSDFILQQAQNCRKIWQETIKIGL